MPAFKKLTSSKTYSPGTVQFKSLDLSTILLPVEDSLCATCGGTGYTSTSTCGNCSGTGICPTCNGTGKVSSTQTCLTCNGSGNITETCSICGGSGTIQNGDIADTCFKCGGSGTLSSTCWTCNGSGTVTVEETCTACNGSAQCNICHGSGTLTETCVECKGGGGINIMIEFTLSHYDPKVSSSDFKATVEVYSGISADSSKLLTTATVYDKSIVAVTSAEINTRLNSLYLYMKDIPLTGVANKFTSVSGSANINTYKDSGTMMSGTTTYGWEGVMVGNLAHGNTVLVSLADELRS